MTSVDLEEKRAKANKPYMVSLDAMDAITLDSPLLRFALRPDIVASAAHYLGVVPILQFANVMYSSHVAAEPSKSQLYHCDSDEAEQIRVFVLCEEVTAASGPLTFVPAAQSQEGRAHGVWPRPDGNRTHRSSGDDCVHRHQSMPALRQPHPR
jgi:hypothetical protein